MKSKKIISIFLSLAMGSTMFFWCLVPLNSQTSINSDSNVQEQNENIEDKKQEAGNTESGKEQEENKKVEENQVVKETNQIVRIYELVDPNTERITVKQSVYVLTIKSTEIKEIVSSMYNFIVENDDIVPSSIIKEAYIDNNNILHVSFDKHFLQNFSGGTFAEILVIKVLNYNFMGIEGVEGVQYNFEESPNCVGLHGDYSEPYTETLDEGYFKIIE